MGRSKVLFLMLSLLFLSILVGPAGAMAGQAVLDESNDGSVVVVVMGQTVELSLASNPSTGYSWLYSQKPDAGLLEETGHEYRQESQLIGAGGREFWCFKAIRAGVARLSLWYARPWESCAPANKFAVDIIITPGIEVLLDGKALEFDVPPFIEGDRVLVPLRSVFEALGAEVSWLPETQQVRVKKEDKTLELTVGRKAAYWKGPKDGYLISLDVSPQIIGDRVFMPLRFICEEMGCRVDWDETNRVVSIFTQLNFRRTNI